MMVGALMALAGCLAGQTAGALEQGKGGSGIETSSQRRVIRSSPTQVDVYPRPSLYPGPDAVRECRAWLEPEARPSGTVIVPRMRCWWVRG
jgi:hypothetical protein